MFENIRRVLDETEEKIANSNITEKDIFDKKLTLALYEDINPYWIARALVALTDTNIPDFMRRAMYDDLKK